MPVGVGSGCRKLLIELLRTGRVSYFFPFLRSLRDGEGRVGGMPVGVGSGCRKLLVELLRTGRVMYFFPFLRSLWDGEGRGGGMPVGVGSGCRELGPSGMGKGVVRDAGGDGVAARLRRAFARSNRRHEVTGDRSRCRLINNSGILVSRPQDRKF